MSTGALLFQAQRPRAFLSSRNPRNAGWRISPSLVHSVNRTSATSFGFTHVVSALALMRCLNGEEGVRNGSSFPCSSSSMACENPVPT